MIKFFKSLFGSNYSPYVLKDTKTEVRKKPIYQLVRNPNYVEEIQRFDTVDPYIKEATGEFNTIERQYELWVAYHKRTGLPRYEKIYIN